MSSWLLVTRFLIHCLFQSENFADMHPQNMKTSAVKILGQEAERMNDVWDLDEEGEMRSIWSRNSGHRKQYLNK